MMAGSKYHGNNEIRHEDLVNELHKLYLRKNRDYGDAFHESFQEDGMTMVRIRLGDKFRRFKTLSKDYGKPLVKDESIRDTLIDMANYALMAVMEIDENAEQVGYYVDNQLEMTQASVSSFPDTAIHATNAKENF